MRVLIFGVGSPGARKPLERVLTRLGHEAWAENDVEAALNLIGEMEIRVVIGDGRLPKFEWIELCRRLRAGGARPYVYFLLIEDPHADDSHEIWAAEAGIDDFLDELANEREVRRRLRLAAGRLGEPGSVSSAENIGAE
jgi:two-component system phosphate regulon response regulator PhoB